MMEDTNSRHTDTRKNLETESIKAVLEAQRAKIAALRRDHQRPIRTGETLPVLTRETSSSSSLMEGENTTTSKIAVVVPGSQSSVKECLSTLEFPVGNLFDGEGDASLGFLRQCDEAQRDVASPGLTILPPQMQERMLVEDLLYSFGGFQGTWIRFTFAVDDLGRHSPKFTFACEKDLDPSLREMVMKMVPLSTYVMIVRRFSEIGVGYSHGLVNQALAGSMRSMLMDWDLMIAQIETQLRSGKPFTLQALWYYIQSPLSAFQLVAKISSDVSSRKLRGSSTLSYLHDGADRVIGDPMASKFMSRILATSTEPYFRMLEHWVCNAVIEDPYDEFVIQENPCITTSDLSTERASSYWTDKFTIRLAHDGAPDVPTFLQGCLKEILSTGKYLDLIRTCGHTFDRPLRTGTRLEYDEDGTYLLRLRMAYQAASAAAVRVLHEHKILHGLESLKKYFLTAQGDLFLAFMDAGDVDLKSSNIPMQQLDDVLQLSVQACSIASDPVASSLQIVYGSKSLHQIMLDLTRNAKSHTDLHLNSSSSSSQLKPIHSMSVSATERSKMPSRSLAMLYYRVPWPLVVVSPDSAVAQYQAFFKHLFDLKWVERELTKTCKLYQATRTLANFDRRHHSSASTGVGGTPAIHNLMLAYTTCHSMMHFFRQYLLYSSFELLDPLWKTLEENLRDASNVDDMIAHHMVFLEKAMKGLFFSRKLKLPPALFKVQELALDFAKLTAKHLDIDYGALDRAAESSVQMENLSGKSAQVEKRRFKARRVRAVIDAALTNPQYEGQLKELSVNFKTRCRDFLSLLMEAYDESKKSKHGSREDLESLSNLIDRLDFNGYFCENVGIHTLAMQ
jgi:gamma-tubulin complex component 2